MASKQPIYRPFKDSIGAFVEDTVRASLLSSAVKFVIILLVYIRVITSKRGAKWSPILPSVPTLTQSKINESFRRIGA
jgi:hypothetical protein